MIEYLFSYADCWQIDLIPATFYKSPFSVYKLMEKEDERGYELTEGQLGKSLTQSASEQEKKEEKRK